MRTLNTRWSEYDSWPETLIIARLAYCGGDSGGGSGGGGGGTVYGGDGGGGDGCGGDGDGGGDGGGVCGDQEGILGVNSV